MSHDRRCIDRSSSHSRRRSVFAALAAAAVVGSGFTVAMPALAQQAWPARPVKIVVPYPPGGPTDIVARLVGAKMSERLKQPFVIENRAGAGGNIGAEAVAKAPADGYTLVLATTAHSINPSLFPSLGYDVVRDFAPVVLLTRSPLVVVVNPQVPATTITELIALAKAKPDTIAYGSSGNGQSTHLAAEFFKSLSGTKMTHVPYKGSAPALIDLAGGQVQVMFDTMLSAMPQAKQGRIRALAVTSATRSGAAPDLPTVAETGLPGYEAVAWFGLLAPAGTPADVVALLNRTANEVLRESDVSGKLIADGADPAGGTPEQFAAHIRSEIEKWRGVVKSAAVKLD